MLILKDLRALRTNKKRIYLEGKRAKKLSQKKQKNSISINLANINNYEDSYF